MKRKASCRKMDRPALRAVALTVAALASIWKPGTVLAELIEDQVLQKHHLARYWKARLPLVLPERIDAIYPVDENLYCVTNQGTLFAVHRRVGIIRWSLELDGGTYPVFAPTHLPDTAEGQGPALVTTARQLRLVERTSGEVLDAFRPRFVPSGPAVSDGERIYLGGLDQRVHCLRLPDFFRQWEITISSPLTTSPIVSGPSLFFVTAQGRAVSCTALDKQLLWQTELGMPVGAQVVLDGKAGLLVPGLGRSLFALDPDGPRQPMWRFRCNGAVSAGPWVTEEFIYFLSEGQGVFALDTAGDMKGLCAEGVSFGAQIGQLAYLLGRDGNIVAFDPAQGKNRYVLPAEGVEFVAPSPDRPSLVVGSADGHLLCARDKDTPYLRADEIEAALKGPQPAAPTVTEAEGEKEPALADRPPARRPLESRSRIDPLGVSKPKE